jgi:FMN reductase
VSTTGHRVGVVVGNPKPHSRTLDVGVAVLRAASEAAGLVGGEELIVDLAGVGPEVLDWSSERVAHLVEAVGGCSLLVVASPTFKASYSGLLKCFLDWFGTTALHGVVTVPVMVGAGPAHALAVEVHLRPILVEIGATLPTRGLYVTEADLARLDEVVAGWLQEAGPALRRALDVG